MPFILYLSQKLHRYNPSTYAIVRNFVCTYITYLHVLNITFFSTIYISSIHLFLSFFPSHSVYLYLSEKLHRYTPSTYAIVPYCFCTYMSLVLYILSYLSFTPTPSAYICSLHSVWSKESSGESSFYE